MPPQAANDSTAREIFWTKVPHDEASKGLNAGHFSGAQIGRLADMLISCRFSSQPLDQSVDPYSYISARPTLFKIHKWLACRAVAGSSVAGECFAINQSGRSTAKRARRTRDQQYSQRAARIRERVNAPRPAICRIFRRSCYRLLNTDDFRLENKTRSLATVLSGMPNDVTAPYSNPEPAPAELTNLVL